jgi:hypothetical protein
MNARLKPGSITHPVGARRVVPVTFKQNNPSTVKPHVGASPAREWKEPSHAGCAPTIEKSAVGQSWFKIILTIYALMSAPLTQAEGLGRLFFTPEQRAQLEYDKVQNTAPGDSRRVLSVSGIVQKHGGDRTVWINGMPQVAGKSDDQSPESVPVAVPGQQQPVKIKVGQKILINPAPPAGH